MQITKLFVLLTVAVCAACSTPVRMSTQELANFKIDCSRRDEQWRFLQSQKSTEKERLTAALQMTSIFGQLSNWWHGTSQDSYDLMHSTHDAFIKRKEQELRQKCLFEDYIKSRK